MTIVDELLIGSARIDQTRKEICAIIKMVLGSLGDEEARLHALPGETVLHQHEYGKWILWRDLRAGLSVKYYRLWKGEETLVCVLPSNEVPLADVQEVRGNLDDFVTSMKKMFPSLNKRLEPLRKVARQEFGIYYEITLYVPSSHPRVGPKGKQMSFRKKSELAFPLPIGTEVHVSIDGDATEFTDMGDTQIAKNSSEADFWVVVRYHSEMSDNYGYLSDDKFVMDLEPAEGRRIHDPKNLARLLKANGWEDMN